MNKNCVTCGGYCPSGTFDNGLCNTCSLTEINFIDSPLVLAVLAQVSSGVKGKKHLSKVLGVPPNVLLLTIHHLAQARLLSLNLGAKRSTIQGLTTTGINKLNQLRERFN